MEKISKKKKGKSCQNLLHFSQAKKTERQMRRKDFYSGLAFHSNAKPTRTTFMKL